NIELRIELAAARDRSVDTELELRHPTPNVEILVIDVESERRNLDRVLGDRWVVFAGNRVTGRQQPHHRQGKQTEHTLRAKPFTKKGSPEDGMTAVYARAVLLYTARLGEKFSGE